MTKLLYLSNTECLEAGATVYSAEHDEMGSLKLTVDRTVFYPQGGGQPSDAGYIHSEGSTFTVSRVETLGTDVIHYGFAVGSWKPGMNVVLHVDESTRRRNSMLHSGGHLVLAVMAGAGRHEPAIKGYHFPDGPYVEFSGVVPEGDRTELLEQLQTRADSMISDQLEVTSTLVRPDTLRDICSNVPANVPNADMIRVVQVGGFWQPCGGTHVLHLGVLKGFKLSAIRSKRGNTRVSYTFDALR